MREMGKGARVEMNRSVDGLKSAAIGEPLDSADLSNIRSIRCDATDATAAIRNVPVSRSDPLELGRRHCWVCR